MLDIFNQMNPIIDFERLICEHIYDKSVKYSINNIIGWYNLIKERKGVSFICGVHGYDNRYNLLNYICIYLYLYLIDLQY